jgi:Tol biopolymer transport system component
MKRLLFLVTLAVLAGAAPASGDRPAATRADGVVVFASNRDGDSDLYAVNPDGTGLTQLTNDPQDDYDPIPSPDGKHILFVGGEDEAPAVINADGSGRRSLPECSTTPGGWSPDSRHFVCSRYDEGLQILDTVDGTSTQFVDSGAKPVWSPDGQTIAYVDDQRLFVVPAAGGARRRLGIRKVTDSAAPAWSPDSQRVAYVAPGSGFDVYSLWTIRADGSGGRRIAQKISEDSPQWSPDGSRIAFVKRLAHYVAAVFTARIDGSGMHQVSVSRAGESSNEPSWTGDGRLVLFSRGRFREADQADIYAVGPVGHGGRALTHPFPSGGTNSTPQWLTGPRVTGHEPSPRTIAFPFKRRLVFKPQIVSVITDGRRAIPLLGVEDARLRIWDPTTGRSVRGPEPCANTYGPGYVALAGGRIAWTCSEAGNTYYASRLQTFRLGRGPAVTVASSYGEPEHGGTSLGDLVGRGTTIVFTNHHEGVQESHDAWVLATSKARKCPQGPIYRSRSVCLRLTGANGGVTTAVDAGKVLTVARNGLVRILSTSGSVLRSWSLGEGIVTGRLRGKTLAVQRGTTLDTYDTATGAHTRTRSLAADEGPAFLLDVQGDLVVYATGGAVHLLRLSSGRDVALRLPGAAPTLDAHLEPAGLFVSWNKIYDLRLGRLGFVPLRVVNARL